MPDKRGSSQRETIDTGKDKRFVKRDEQGRFEESEDVSRSLSQDVQRDAQNKARPGQGDRGDRKRKE